MTLSLTRQTNNHMIAQTQGRVPPQSQSGKENLKAFCRVKSPEGFLKVLVLVTVKEPATETELINLQKGQVSTRQVIDPPAVSLSFGWVFHHQPRKSENFFS